MGISPPKLPTISVVVPVFNSALILPELVKRIQAVLPSVSSEFELLLVNDGSCDGSWETIQEATMEHSWVHGINLMRNYGQHNALLCGILSARFETIVTIDDDLQHPPEEISKLLRELENGFDVVYGAPAAQQHGVLRNCASAITKLVLQGSMGAENARHVSAFRAFRAQVRKAFALRHGPFVSIDVVLSWATTRFSFVRVKHMPRSSGASNYTIRMLMMHTMNMVTGFSTLPLKLSSFVGLFFTLVGAMLFVFVLTRYLLFGTTVPGFTFLALSITVFAGAQLFALGIMGEYLARMHFRLMDRPAFIIRDSIGTKER